MRSQPQAFPVKLSDVRHSRLTRWFHGKRERGLWTSINRRVNAVKENLPKYESSMLFARAIGLTQKIDIINLAA